MECVMRYWHIVNQTQSSHLIRSFLSMYSKNPSDIFLYRLNAGCIFQRTYFMLKTKISQLFPQFFFLFGKILAGEVSYF